MDLENEGLEDVDPVDLVFDAIGGEILDRSAAVVRPGGTVVTITLPPKVSPIDGRAVFFVVEPDRGRLADLARQVRTGRITPSVGSIHSLSGVVRALQCTTRPRGKTIIRMGDEPGVR